MKNNQISLDQNYHFSNQNSFNGQLHNQIQNDEYQQIMSMNKKQNNLINNGGFIVNSNNLNNTQHYNSNQQPTPKTSFLNLTNPEEEKQRKMNMYKQELLTQIEKEKIKKREQKKLDKIKEEEEERKINEYWERKKKLVNDMKHRNKDKLNGDDDLNITNIQKNEKDNKMNNSLGKDLHSSRLDNDDNVNSRRRVQIKVKDENEKNKEINTSQGNIENINQNYFVNSPIRFDNYMRRKLLNDELNTQMLNLRQDISKQTRELNEYILNLKSEVVEAKRLKFEAENQLYSIREEINKKKANEAIFEVTFNKILEKNAPYNNLHIPIHEVHPIEIKRKRREDEERLINGKLNSKSEFIYMNDDDLIRNFRRDNKNKSDVVIKQLEGKSEFIHDNELIRRSNTNNINSHNNDNENNNEEDFIDKLKNGKFKKKDNNENLLITSIPKTYPMEFENNEDDINNEDTYKEKFQKHLSEIKKMNNKYITTTKIREIDSYLDNLLIKKN